MTTPRKPLPSMARLRELFFYHPDGFLVRKVKTGISTFVGQEVHGCPYSSGYRTVGIDGRQYLLHRIIYQFHYGWCPDDPDHEDRDNGNNRIGNLRPSTPSENACNRSLFTSSSTGVTGVNRYFDRYQAQVTRDGIRHYLGLHDTIAEASLAIEVFNGIS